MKMIVAVGESAGPGVCVGTSVAFGQGVGELARSVDFAAATAVPATIVSTKPAGRVESGATVGMAGTQASVIASVTSRDKIRFFRSIAFLQIASAGTGLVKPGLCNLQTYGVTFPVG